MIKLKSLLSETNYIGNVDAYDKVNGFPVKTGEDVIHTELKLGTGNRWRYVEYEKSVVWTEDPPSMEYIQRVNDWLAKRNIFPKYHYTKIDNLELWSDDEL